MAGEIAIKVDHVSKTFKLPHERQNSIKGALISRFRSGKRTFERQEVLKDVSFEVKKGEFFGIVGRNGSGKSTLLKMLAGIYTPTKGGIAINGKLTPFIELGVGFSPELTGRENVFLNGALLGFNRAEMLAMYDDIVAFAELEKFMDQKLKNYSSGMQVRLAFSIAIRAQSDILLLDEVLAVGDEAFQRKCFTYFKELKNSGKTVILVTHDMNSVREYCDKAILIEQGDIIKRGSAESVSRAYTELFNPLTHEEVPVTRWGDERLIIDKVSVRQNDTKKDSPVMDIGMTIKCNEPVGEKVKVAYTVKSEDGRVLFGNGVESDEFGTMEKGESVKSTMSFTNILGDGKYVIDLSLSVVGQGVYCDAWLDCASFSVKSGTQNDLSILVDTKLSVGN